jgi:hypothetical protein
VTPILQLVVGPLLVGAATLAARRFGPRAGGLVSAFPAIVGPVLLLTALEHGAAFAADAATGTLLGLVALSGFTLVYGRAATRTRWPASLSAAWVAAAALAAAAGAIGAGFAGALAAAVLSLAAAHRALPGGGAATALPPVPRWDLPVRIALTALLVVSLTAAADRLGPLVGGLLAALPVLASVLAVFTHAQYGPAALADLLRGMLGGMTGFVVFCALVGALVVPTGIPVAFTVAALGALAVHGALARASVHPAGDGPPAHGDLELAQRAVA